MQIQNTLPDHSKVWIYQSNRPFTITEKTGIVQKANEFVAQWAAHGNKLHAAIEIVYDQFIVVFLDEALASATGCSIDKAFKLIQSFESDYKISLLDRTIIAYKEQDEIKTAKMNAFEDLVKAGKITEATTVFNNLVATKQELLTKWEVPVKDSWHERFLGVKEK